MLTLYNTLTSRTRFMCFVISCKWKDSPLSTLSSSLCLIRVSCALWLTLLQGWTIWAPEGFCTGTWLHATACESIRGRHWEEERWELEIKATLFIYDCVSVLGYWYSAVACISEGSCRNFEWHKLRASGDTVLMLGQNIKAVPPESFVLPMLIVHIYFNIFLF